MTAAQRIADAKRRIGEQGPCAMCGAKYAAHRLVDMQMGRAAAGESLESIAEDYGCTVLDMLASWVALVELLNEASIPKRAVRKTVRKSRVPRSSGFATRGTVRL